MEKLSQKNNRPLKSVSEAALLVLQDWHWPGNVRELENVVEKAVVLSRTEKSRFKIYHCRFGKIFQQEIMFDLPLEHLCM